MCSVISERIKPFPGKEFGNVPPRVNKFILPISKRNDLVKEISVRKSKERSYVSLNENVMSPDNSVRMDQLGFSRSKSFGNDFADAIPFIDSSDENGCGAEANSAENDDTLLEDLKKVQDKNDETVGKGNSCPSSSLGASETPDKSDKNVQTDDSSESPTKRSPKKRFPRLGTFERIKIEKKAASESASPSNASPAHTKTGTSFRHRRPIKTTASKELLLKSTPISPSKEEKDNADVRSQPTATEKKKSRGIFSRFWRRDSKDQEKSEGGKEEQQKESNVDEVVRMECPPDYESAVRSTGKSWVSCTEI